MRRGPQKKTLERDLWLVSPRYHRDVGLENSNGCESYARWLAGRVRPQKKKQEAFSRKPLFAKRAPEFGED